MDPSRRRVMLAGGALAGGSLASAWLAVPCVAAEPPRRASDVTLPGPSDWDAALESSRALRKPIVLMFSRVGCPYCLALRRDSMRHLAAEAGSRGILFFELDVADTRPIGAGSGTTAAGLARSMHVTMTPTVVFVGPQGELAERLVGYGSRDFYNAYLEERIEQARTRIAGS